MALCSCVVSSMSHQERAEEKRLMSVEGWNRREAQAALEKPFLDRIC